MHYLFDSGMALLLETALKGGLILLCAGLIYRRLKSNSASLRHGLLTAALSGVLALTLMSPLMPAIPLPAASWTLEWLPETNEPRSKPSRLNPSPQMARERNNKHAAGQSGQKPRSDQVGEQGGHALVVKGDSARKPENGLAWLAVLVVAAWLLGCFWLTASLVRELGLLRRLARGAGLADESMLARLTACREKLGGVRSVRLLMHDDQITPITWGALRPTILLPREARQWTPEMLDIVLLHELSHVKRWDYLSQVLGHLACVLHWFNPFAWRTAAKMKLEREKACDDLVLALGGKASAYAETLLRVAQAHRPGNALPTALALTEEKELKQRIKAILNPNLDRAGASRRKAFLVGAGMLAAALLLSAVKPMSEARATAAGPVEPEAAAPQKTGAETSVDNAALQSLLEQLNHGEPLTRAQAACMLGKARAAEAVPHLEALLDDDTAVAEFDCYPEAERRRWQDYDWAPRYEVFMAASPGESAALALAAIGEPALEPLLSALDHANPAARRNAVWALAEIRAKVPADRVQDELLAFLGDGDWAMRRAAAYTLGELDVRAAEPGLVEALNDVRWEVRREAAWALGELEMRTSVVPLATALSDEAWQVRKTAAWALGEIESNEAVSALGDAMGDENAEVRRASAWALGEIESTDGVAFLTSALKDPDGKVRQTAVWALGEIESDLAVPGLAESLTDQDPEIRKKAAWALGEIESAQAVPALANALTDANEEVRRTAAWALGEIEAPEAVEGLAVALGDESVEVRKRAVWALGEIEHDSAVPALSLSLRDAVPEIRKKAAWALGEIEARGAVPALTAALEDDAAEVRETAVWALGEIGDPAAAPALAARLVDAETAIRKKAAWALGEIKARDAVPALATALGDSAADVRETAIWALGEIQDEAAAPALAASLRDEAEASLRKKAAWALGEIGSEAAVDGLGEALFDKEESVRLMAAWALGEIGSPEAEPALRQALETADPKLKKRLQWALKEIREN